KLVRALGDADVARILDDMPADDRTALLEELPAKVTQKLISLLSPEQRQVANQLLGYPKDSIGRRMTPHYVAIAQAWTIAEVLAHLRKTGAGKEGLTLNQLYVVDDASRLIDYVRLARVVVAQPETPVTALLEGSDRALRAPDDQETAVA